MIKRKEGRICSPLFVIFNKRQVIHMREITIDLATPLPVYDCGNCGEANAARLKVDISSIKSEADFYVAVFKNALSETYCSEKYTPGSDEEYITVPLTQELTKTAKESFIIEAYATDENNELVLLRKSPVISLTFEGSISSDDAIAFDKELFGLYKELFDKTNELNSGLDILDKQITVVNAASEKADESAETALTAADNANNVAESLIKAKNNGEFNGAPGEKGDKGDTGTQGEPGKDGAAATVTVGTVTTGDPDTPASVTNSGTENAAVLDFVIPQGEKGDSAFTSIKPGTQEEPYIIQKYGYYCTTGVGWVQVGTQGQDISTISELEFYKPFYCGTNTLIVFGLSNKYVNVESAFIYLITVGDDIKASVYPATSGSTKEPFNYSLEEIILSLMAYVNIFQPVFDEGANAVDKVIKVGSYDNSHGIFQLAPTDEYRKKSAIIAQADSNITLNDNTEYRMQVAATINLTLPTSINDDYECSLVFESGDTATVLSYAADSIKFVGDDCDEEGDFIPQANTAYEVNIKNLGYNRIIARVGAF